MYDQQLIVGLGNPGRQYEQTRHNLGFMVVDYLSGKYGLNWSRGRGKSRVAKGTVNGESVILVKPQTFMNLSGLTVGQLVRFYKMNTNALLVICDDINLPYGRIRLRGRGSDGGHNGLASIILNLGTQDFARLRIGIGMNYRYGNMTNYVLDSFNNEEMDELDSVIKFAADATVSFICEGLEATMNNFNRLV